MVEPGPSPAQILFRRLAIVGLIGSALGAAFLLVAAWAIAANEDFFGEPSLALEVFAYTAALGLLGACLATIGLVRRSRGMARTGAIGQGIAVVVTFALWSSAPDPAELLWFFFALVLVIAVDVYVVVAASAFPRRPTDWASR